MGFRCSFWLVLISLSLASAAEAGLFLGEDVVVVTASDDSEIVGKVCNFSTEVCEELSRSQGIARTSIRFQSGDLVGFIGSIGSEVVNEVSSIPRQRNFDWLERIALVVAGAVVGFLGNLIMTLYTDKRKDRIEQRGKFREWRDKMLLAIKQRESGQQVEFSADIPDGLSQKTSKKIHALEGKLKEVENRLNAQPDKADDHVRDAKKILLGPMD